MKERTGETVLTRGIGFVWEVLKIVVISSAIVIPIRYFLVQPFFVRGSSMEPNFDDGQYLVIDEISYRFSEPARGDVVVFRYPKRPDQYYIKRIIGLPSEAVEIKEGKIVIYNDEFPDGRVLNESVYLQNWREPASGSSYLKLGDDEYFVLGDNRRASSDSREWGELARKYIIGRVWIRAWPLASFTMF